MDEPMEAEADSTQPDLAADDGDQRVKHHPLLRPGSMGLYLEEPNVVPVF